MTARRSLRAWTLEKLKKLIELLEESGIAEIEIKEAKKACASSRMRLQASQLPTLCRGCASAHRGTGASAAASAVRHRGADCRAHPKSSENTSSPRRWSERFIPRRRRAAKAFVELGDESSPDRCCASSKR